MAATSSFPDPHGQDRPATDHANTKVNLFDEQDIDDDAYDYEAQYYYEDPSSSSSLLLLQQRISQTHPHTSLSPQALKLLAEASTHLSSSMLPTSTPHFIDGSSSLLTPLYKQLESLRQLIPLQPTQETIQSSPSCLITGTLDYLEQLHRKKQSLLKRTQESSYFSNIRSDEADRLLSPKNMVLNRGLIKVEHVSDSNFHVHVQCKMRRGLLAPLLFALESLGLVINQMDVSCDQMLTLDLSTSKVKLARLDKNIVHQALQRTTDGAQKL